MRPSRRSPGRSRRQAGWGGGAALVAAALLACNDPPVGPMPANLVSASMLPEAGVPGAVLIDTVRVRLVDQEGRPVPGTEITWNVREGGGSVKLVNTVTDENGASAVRWTLGPGLGTNRLRASTLEGGQVDFRVMGEVFQVDRLAAGLNVACGLRQGALWCWGNGFWLLWTQEPVSIEGWRGHFTANLVDSTHGFIELALSSATACGLDRQAVVWCADSAVREMTRVAGLPPVWRVVGFTALWYGTAGFCGLAVSDSTAWCWGAGRAPAQLLGSRKFTSLALAYTSPASGAPQSYWACGLVVDSTAVCWVGEGTSPPSFFTPGPEVYAEIAVADEFACGRTRQGEVYCWGTNVPGDKSLPPLPPRWMASGVFAISASEWELGLVRQFGEVEVMAINGFTIRPNGIGSPIERFALGSPTCALSPGGGVYCYNDMGWGGDTYLPYEWWVAIQPLRQVADSTGGGAP